MSVPAPAPGEVFSFRQFVAELERRGELATVSRNIPEGSFEISACLSALHQGPALLFTATGASGIPIVGNVLNSIDRVALGLGITRADLPTFVAQAIGRPLKPNIVEAGPCQERDMGTNLAALPIPRFFELETGPYITAGCIVAKDPETGFGNLSYARLKPLGGNRALIGIAPNHHLAVMARKAAALGKKLPIAVTLGNHPAVLIAAALYLKLGDDELEVAGALRGSPIDTVRCKTSDLLVPATCEIVIEGEIDDKETIEEGPVSEYHGMYERYGAGHVVRVTAITRRRDAMLQVIEPGFHLEHLLLGGVAIAAGVESILKAVIPAARRVAVSNSGCGRLSAVVTLGGDHRPGDARKAILAALCSVNLIKQVTVVDDDIDPWDEFAVQYAIATRMRADRDIMIVPGMRTDRSEPMKLGGTIANYGFDATKRASDRDDWTPALPPKDVSAKVEGIVAAIRAGERKL